MDKDFYTDKLTIVMPLYNRELLTIRYLQYLEYIQFPFTILLADGGNDKELQSLLESKAVAPSVNYTYVRFPSDLQLLDYYKKLHVAVSLVTTPYVMLHDNDDFPIESGIRACIAFLENNRDYVGTSGKVGGTTVKNNGSDASFFFHEESYDGAVIDSFEHDSALARIRHQLTVNRSVNAYYGIYKTQSVVEILRDLQELNFNDLRLNEAYFIQGMMTFGKVKYLDEYYTYFRQRDTSVGTTFLKPWVQDLFFDQWMDQFERYSVQLSQRISGNAADSYEHVRNELKGYFLEYLLKKPFTEPPFWQKMRDIQRYKSILLKTVLKSTFFKKYYTSQLLKEFLKKHHIQSFELEKIPLFLQSCSGGAHVV